MRALSLRRHRQTAARTATTPLFTTGAAAERAILAAYKLYRSLPKIWIFLFELTPVRRRGEVT